MKKFFMLTVVIMLMVSVMTVQAEVTAGSFSVTPFAGGYFFEGNENLKTTYTAGLRVGYNLTENFGVEGFFNYIPTEIQNVPDEPWQNVYGYGIEGIYHFMPEGPFVPFLAVGIGGIHYGYPEPYRSNKVAVDYGAGLKYFLPNDVAELFMADNIALRADVRHVIPFNDRYNDLLCTFGIEFAFGGQKKEVVAAKAEEPAAPVEVIPPRAEEPVAPVEVIVPRAEEPAAPVEVIVPRAEEPAAPVEVIAPKAEETVVPKEAVATEDVQNSIAKWLTSWKSGDMKTYRGCYASDFQSKGMNLNAWISYKADVRQRSKNINISIDNLQVSADANIATAVFTQSYSSSILKDTGKKTLKLKKVNDEWKIYREII